MVRSSMRLEHFTFLRNEHKNISDSLCPIPHLFLLLKTTNSDLQSKRCTQYKNLRATNQKCAIHPTLTKNPPPYKLTPHKHTSRLM